MPGISGLRSVLAAALVFAILISPVRAEDEATGEPKPQKAAPPGIASHLGALKFRSLGPAFMAGRVGDLAVDPSDASHYWVVACSGGVWRTTNAGTTWRPVFDGQGSYSIGCLRMDPQNPNVVWVGTGENNSQRSVSWGDGVYRTRDGGKTWQRMGLEKSEHIGMIQVDPRDSRVVYVAAQGPLWKSGGERGLYKSTDGGASWNRVLHISDDTGVNEVHFDPRNPDVLYASAYQRRRHVWTLINGGPESTVYKSEDAGVSWRKIQHGLPSVEKGRIGLAVAPSRPDTVYAIVEAAQGKSGFYRSTDRGESWQRMSGHKTTSPQYYNEIVCDPIDADRVYALDTSLHVTTDGGKTFRMVPRQNRHVDDHALWIDPRDPRHMRVGCDGGVYETWDRGQAWEFKSNLPITQFYRVAVDQSLPFYYVYGGTQDNNTQGGPSRTTDRAGITNADWFVTVGGDGYETVVDPTDPMIVYSQWQYGGLVRHDRRTGERVDLRPRVDPGDPPLRWNWDSPLLMSPHDSSRLYFAANILFRSDDRGDGWRAVSGDLTRQLDRNQLEVMGRIQPPEAVAKDDSTSIYGNCVSLDESPLVEGLLYVGTDDGLIQITEDGGANWRTVAQVEGVPERTYVSCLRASCVDPDTVFAAFDNHKMGDFAPYLFVSRDRGRSWNKITTGLPMGHVVYTVQQDHMKAELLFVGTEFGCFTSLDGGAHWMRLRGGLPTIAVRDLELQRRESDLVLGTFGRGIYILDNYDPLRHLTPEGLGEAPQVLPIKPAYRYIQRSRLGQQNGKGWQGAGYYAAPNPAFGATITYTLPEKLETRKEQRLRIAAERRKAKQPVAYPSVEALRAEAEEAEPRVYVEIQTAGGRLVARLPASRNKGLHRVSWNLRTMSVKPIRPGSQVGASRDGELMPEGAYVARLVVERGERFASLSPDVGFQVVALPQAPPARGAAPDPAAVPAALRFRRRAAELQRAVSGTLRVLAETKARVEQLRQAALRVADLQAESHGELGTLRRQLRRLETTMLGDRVLRAHDLPASRGIRARVNDVVGNLAQVTSGPTRTQREELARAEREFAPVLLELRDLVTEALPRIEATLEAAKAPHTPGRLPDWKLPR